ncbi:Sphingosine-1-phosphate lyase 1 [Porphyridium purpureum]|uniref:sphinganine-1-phosphate aldolase n=1 Tax=Porphyridium purpureum TaxID=35688 RepID=A0A5J4Z833_PORPP|nr:Sphingosine-1-phosphate lyase 1 [Porphyridium purpureum]|eukprot:POR6144..scf295_1
MKRACPSGSSVPHSEVCCLHRGRSQLEEQRGCRDHEGLIHDDMWKVEVPSDEKVLVLCGCASGVYVTSLLWLSTWVRRRAREEGGWAKLLGKWSVGLARKAPFAGRVIDAELDKAKQSIRHGMRWPPGNTIRGLPDVGVPEKAVLSQLRDWAAEDNAHWQSGKISGAVYHGRPDLLKVAAAAMESFLLSNPLHPGVFAAVRRMEAEVVAMTLSLFHADVDSGTGCGTTTSGGTESILLACKAYRDWGRAKGVVRPNIVVAKSAHAAFFKAGAYFGIDVEIVEVDPVTFAADVQAISRKINRDTVALVASAPSFPHGIVDPVREIAALAESRGIGCHVDCCLGSFLIPCVAEVDKSIPAFDFSVSGVSSISCDPHKYGFAPKGTSVIMYRDAKLRAFQYHVSADWTGGVYATATLAGSRSGALVAGCWAVMTSMGKAGYREAAEQIMKSTKTVLAGVRVLDDLQVCGDPKVSVVAFQSTSLNVFNVLDAMSSRGWELNALQDPPALHLCVTLMTDANAFVEDLKASVEEVRTAPAGAFKDGQGAMYGLAASIPDRSIVGELAVAYVDALYEMGA